MRAIPGFSRYYITANGEVFSTIFSKSRQLKHKIDPDGYPRVSLLDDHGVARTNLGVHRLVLLAFAGPPPAGHSLARHLNGDASDCRLENLAWGSHSDNVRDAVEHGTHQHARKTHCIAGHPYDAANTYVRPDRPNSRTCRECQRQASARYREKNAA